MSDPIQDGGPAFPLPIMARLADGQPLTSADFGGAGMTLRDWFAGQALVADCDRKLTAKEAAEFVYHIADEMLKAREKKSFTDSKPPYTEPEVESTFLNSIPNGYRFMTAGELIGPGCLVWLPLDKFWMCIPRESYGEQQEPGYKYICPIEGD